jgi:hypothetical protein
MYTVCIELPGKIRRDGRNYPKLATAERRAMERAYQSESDTTVLILGNDFGVIARHPGQIQKSEPNWRDRNIFKGRIRK